MLGDVREQVRRAVLVADVRLLLMVHAASVYVVVVITVLMVFEPAPPKD